jgi:hypothetical protein
MQQQQQQQQQQQPEKQELCICCQHPFRGADIKLPSFRAVFTTCTLPALSNGTRIPWTVTNVPCAKKSKNTSIHLKI